MAQPKQTTVLTLRPMLLADVDLLAKWFEDAADYALFDRNATIPVSVEALREAWEEELSSPKSKARWFIVEDSKHVSLALGGLQSINAVHGDAVLPVFISRRARGRGIGTRLIGLLFDIAFDELKLARVTTYLRSDNVISRRLTSKVGFVEEGRIRRAWRADGYRFDMMALGILRDEWAALRPRLSAELGQHLVIKCDMLGNGTYHFPAYPRGAGRSGKVQ
jgi:RimJ/RimL family protein N-acetyltransferase